jgi:Prophage tail length tape measure protein
VARELRVEIIGDASSLQRALGAASRSTQSFGRSAASTLGGLAKGGAIGVAAAGVTGFAIAMKRGISEFSDGQKVMAQTNAVIKSTGGAADVSAKQVDALAQSISAKSGIDDQAIASGENMLLTFTNIHNEVGKGNDVFNQATKTLADMSTATGTDMSKSAIQLGKALNDPIKGVGALSRVGVTFTEGQKKTIKTLVDSGKTMEAQKIILHELGKEFGGSAEAAGKTLPGTMNKLKNSFDNAAAGMVQGLTPALNSFASWTQAHMPEIEATFKAIGTGLQYAFKGIGIAIRAVIPVIASLVDWFKQNWPEIERITLEVFNKIAPIVMGVFTTVKSIIQGAVTLIQAIWGKFGDIIIAQVKTAFDFIRSTIENAMNVIRGIVDVIGGLIHGDFGRVWDGIKEIFSGMAGQVIAIFKFFGTTLLHELEALGRLLLIPLQAAWDGIKSAASAAWAGILGLLNAAWNGIKGAAATAWSAITATITTAKNAMVAVFTGIGHAISSLLDAAWTLIKIGALNAAKAIVEPFSHLPGSMGAWARKIKDNVNAELDGITASKAATKIVADFKLGINPASKAGHDLGVAYMAGIAAGIGAEEAEAMAASVAGINKVLAAGHAALGKPHSPAPATIPFGVSMMEGIAWGLKQGTPTAVSAVTVAMHTLGASLVSSLNKALGANAGGVKSGMGKVGDMIVAAAKKYGVDARAALAVAMHEGGVKFGGVGDNKSSFGPFQQHIGGRNPYGDPAQAAAYSNSIRGIEAALKGMADEGARGQTGLQAITTIVEKYEEPLKKLRPGEIAAAFADYKKIPEAISGALVAGAPKVVGGVQKIYTSLAAMVKAAAPVIGIENARGIIAGLDLESPHLVQRAAAAMTKAIDAQKAVLRTNFVGAFNDMAQAALAAFDARAAAWKPFSQTVLDASALKAQIAQVEESLAAAMAGISGGGAAAAADIEKTLGPALANAMAGAMSQISGAKTEEALAAASRRAQTSITAAITAATSGAVIAAQNAVDTARTALTQAQAGGDPDAIAAAQQALDTAVSNQKTLNDAVQAEVDAATGRLVIAEQTKHDQIEAKSREGFARQLVAIRQGLANGNLEWDKAGEALQKLLTSYHVRLVAGGTAWANKFADGITAGIPAVRAAAQAMARAAAVTIPQSPAKEGPLAFDIVKAGQKWASGFGEGIKAADPLFVSGKSIGAAFGGGPAPSVAAGVAVNVTVQGALLGTSVPEVADTIYRELVRKRSRNPTGAF